MKYVSVKAVANVLASNKGIIYYDLDDNRFYPSVSDTNNQMHNYRVESLEYVGEDSFRLYIAERGMDEVTDELTVANFKQIAYNLNNYEYTDMNDNGINDLRDIWDEFEDAMVEYIGVRADNKTVVVQTDYEQYEED